jgi:hypothetical protein
MCTLKILPRHYGFCDQFSLGVTRMQTFEVPLIQWLERNGFTYDMCAASDLDQNGDLVSHYQMFVSVGHDEYWSEGMRDAFEGFIDGGGNAAFLSGNTCWRRVTFSPDGTQMFCGKESGVLAIATFIDTTDNNERYYGTMVSLEKGKPGNVKNKIGKKGKAAAAVAPSGGLMFNAASINWVTALSQQQGLWNTADQITWNVFNRMIT